MLMYANYDFDDNISPAAFQDKLSTSMVMKVIQGEFTSSSEGPEEELVDAEAELRPES